MHNLYEKVKRGENPVWLSEMNSDFNDSFDYALDSAESAYKRMVRTNSNIEIIRNKLLKDIKK